MADQAQHAVDRTGWASGPWDDEPDQLGPWKDEATGLPCLARRSPTMGAWCGYVAVPPGHPAHGQHYDKVQDVDVHGGLTYGAACSGSICHVPEPGEPDDVWWLGFDCGHCDDLTPALAALRQASRLWSMCGYRNLDYVKDQIISLARQLAEMGSDA